MKRMIPVAAGLFVGLFPIICMAHVQEQFAVAQSAGSSASASSGFDLELEFMAGGFNRPCEIVNSGLPDDERLFVVEQQGRIRILNLDGTVEATPFLNIQGSVQSTGNEQGLLGLAFSPYYADSGYFFVNYTRSQGTQLRTRISRFSVNPDNPNQALADSEVTVLEFVQDFGNHNGGQIAFGPDGYLYIASGDGGSGGDPNNRSQSLSTLLGKMLRIDVATLPYTTPADNPFVENALALDEIWSYGLRNPWKFAFDELTGDIYMGDVGQSTREEVNFEPADSPGGLNFGWRCYEGFQPFNLAGCTGFDFTEPIMDYAYGNQGNGFRCSITGGRVYRGETYGNLSGKYIAVDYCSGEYWIMWQNGDGWEVYLSPVTLTGSIVAFGTDLNNELYAVKGGNQGAVYRVKENCSLLEMELSFDGTALNVSLSGEQYLWFLDNELVTTTTVPTLEVDQNGAYQVQALTANGCIVTSNIENVTGLNTNNYRRSKLGLYPNPATHSIRLSSADFHESGGLVKVTIVSAEGRVVAQHTAGVQGHEGIHIDIQALPAGYYVVQAASGSKVANGAFVKQP